MQFYKEQEKSNRWLGCSFSEENGVMLCKYVNIYKRHILRHLRYLTFWDWLFQPKVWSSAKAKQLFFVFQYHKSQILFSDL